MANTEIDLDALAALAGLDIPPDYRAGVAEQFAGLMLRAKEVLAVRLPDELEPAPIFTLKDVTTP